MIVTLSNPREKFWGMILALKPEGLSLSGAELASIEDITLMVKNGEPSALRQSLSSQCIASSASNLIRPSEICRRFRSVSATRPD